MGAMTGTYAEVAWSVSDVQDLKPEWTNEQAIDFLSRNESDIQEAMIQRGWNAIEDLLHYEEKE